MRTSSMQSRMRWNYFVLEGGLRVGWAEESEKNGKGELHEIEADSGGPWRAGGL